MNCFPWVRHQCVACSFVSSVQDTVTYWCAFCRAVKNVLITRNSHLEKMKSVCWNVGNGVYITQIYLQLAGFIHGCVPLPSVHGAYCVTGGDVREAPNRIAVIVPGFVPCAGECWQHLKFCTLSTLHFGQEILPIRITSKSVSAIILQ